MEIAIQALWLNQGQFRSILQGLHTIVYTFSNLKFALFAFQLTYVQLGKVKGGGVSAIPTRKYAPDFLKRDYSTKFHDNSRVTSQCVYFIFFD